MWSRDRGGFPVLPIFVTTLYIFQIIYKYINNPSKKCDNAHLTLAHSKVLCSGYAVGRNKN